MSKIEENISFLLQDISNKTGIIFDNNLNYFRSNKKKFIKVNNIYDFFVPENSSDFITNKQEKFYEEIKFPNYDGLETYGDLLDKSSKTNHLASILDKNISYNSKVLEVGCGTGQLSLFLKRYNRLICGIDLSIPSLNLAESFRIRNDINNVFFLKMNIFNLQFKEGVFDYIISNGVLHHTYDTEKAFSKILTPLKKGGYVIIGLYHKYGRLYTNLRQKLIGIFGEKLKFLDKRTTDKNISKEKRYAWLKDQYKNPHETSHTVKQVKNWFKKYGVDYITSIPFEEVNLDTDIFTSKGESEEISLLRELSLMFSLSQIKEGGFFVIVGKKLV